jgi:hypothetical protein
MVPEVEEGDQRFPILMRQATTFSLFLPPFLLANVSMAASADARVSAL